MIEIVTNAYLKHKGIIRVIAYTHKNLKIGWCVLKLCYSWYTQKMTRVHKPLYQAKKTAILFFLLRK